MTEHRGEHRGGRGNLNYGIWGFKDSIHRGSQGRREGGKWFFVFWTLFRVFFGWFFGWGSWGLYKGWLMGKRVFVPKLIVFLFYRIFWWNNNLSYIEELEEFFKVIKITFITNLIWFLSWDLWNPKFMFLDFVNHKFIKWCFEFYFEFQYTFVCLSANYVMMSFLSHKELLL